MILVDTSVLVDWFRGADNPACEKFAYILDSGLPFGISSLTCQELLQGARDEQEFILLKNYLETQNFFQPLHPIDSYIAAARLYYLCRRKGLTIRSTVDCLIARIALEHDLLLLHNDKDFEQIGTVIELKSY